MLLYFDLFLSGAIFRDADITISAWTGLERRKPQPRWWSSLMPLTDKHCEHAIADDIARAESALKILRG